VTASANLDLVRSIYAAWERGDFSSTDWAHPEIEWVLADGPSPGRWTGVAGMTEGWRGWMTAWKEFRVEADDYRELDHGRVLVLVEFGGRGMTSGVDVGQMRTMGAALWHVRDGKVRQMVGYWDRERALADLGLTPEGEAS
jgi:ketosteroid isomerase-like protein